MKHTSMSNTVVRQWDRPMHLGQNRVVSSTPDSVGVYNHIPCIISRVHTSFPSGFSEYIYGLTQNI